MNYGFTNILTGKKKASPRIPLEYEAIFIMSKDKQN